MQRQMQRQGQGQGPRPRQGQPVGAEQQVISKTKTGAGEDVEEEVEAFVRGCIFLLERQRTEHAS
jgi:hypothetical protein